VPLAEAGGLLASLSGQKLALDRASCPVLIADLASAGGAEIVWQDDPLIRMKAQKNAAELAGFQAAHLQDALAFVEFWHWLEQQDITGFTESQLADHLQERRAARPGYICDSFPAIIGFAENAAVVHYRARPGQDRQITPDNLLLIDSGGHYQQGTTDITRTLAIGRPPAEAVAAASSVLAGHCELARAVFPASSSGAQLDALARAPLWERQLDYGHGTGHGVGHILSVHEGPVSLSPRSDKPVQAGMVLSNEPGYYKPGAYGVRQENLVVVEKTSEGWLKLAPLTLVPFDRRLADPAFFSSEQLAWLNQYHRSVEAALTPHVPEPVRGWLAEKCAPIAG
jgi:Xaa-Pro aminopeptidase